MLTIPVTSPWELGEKAALFVVFGELGNTP